MQFKVFFLMSRFRLRAIFWVAKILNIFLECCLVFNLETSTFEELGSEFINFACNCVINTLRLIVYLTGFSI